MESLPALEKYAQTHQSAHMEYSRSPVFNEGNTASGVYYILNNHVRILKDDQQGQPQFLWSAGPGEIIGLTSFFHGKGKYTCSALSGKKPCRIVHIPNEEFTELLKQSPTLKRKLLKLLCQRIHFMEVRTKNMLYLSIDERIVETLLFLAKKDHPNTEPNKKELLINYSITELAEMVGASLEYFRRRIKKLKSQRIIDYGKHGFFINDLHQLQLLNKS